jgi:hypothetical protein
VDFHALQNPDLLWNLRFRGSLQASKAFVKTSFAGDKFEGSMRAKLNGAYDLKFSLFNGTKDAWVPWRISFRTY